jgi:hypothetical protein
LPGIAPPPCAYHTKDVTISREGYQYLPHSVIVRPRSSLKMAALA